MRQIDIETIREALKRIEPFRKQCAACGEDFYPARSSQLHCSKCQGNIIQKGVKHR